MFEIFQKFIARYFLKFLKQVDEGQGHVFVRLVVSLDSIFKRFLVI